jgi:voltage-gated potassium channel
MTADPAAPPGIRRQLYDILEQSRHGDLAGRLVETFILALVLINIAAVILETVPDLDRQYHGWFVAIEVVSLVVFTIEYGLRIYVAVEHEPYKHLKAWQARWQYIRSPEGIVDLVAILPFWFGYVAPDEARIVMVLRVLRFLKIARYSRSMQSLLDTVYNERRALGGCVIIFAGLTIVSATLMHAAEGRVQPDKFGTIPDAMWWAIVTLGTIGYGDAVPVTAAGKVIAGFTIVAAIVTIALPVGIIATAFADQIHRRDFIVTWGMVSRVPLFSGLTAGEIADVMRLLRAETRETGAIIARRGDAAHSMYFVARGSVEIELPNARHVLEEGHFFGEMAALRRVRRTATARALQHTSLLVLDAKDLHALMERQPMIAARLRETIRKRLGSEMMAEGGDLVAEEIEGDDNVRSGPPANIQS